MIYDEITLPNGLRVIGEKLDHVRSVSVGIWVGAGSQYETPDENGLSHFLEHMMFKGTARRSAREIAEVMDGVGGHMNAFTAKDCTCYYCRVVDEHLPLAIDVLSDMVMNSVFDKTELDKERGVILEEIAMTEDTPDDLVSEQLMIARFGDQAIARPILGTEDHVKSFTRDDLVKYHRAMYCPENTVVAVAGNYVWSELTELLNTYMGAWSGDFKKRVCETLPSKPGIIRTEKDIEQTHICLGYPGIASGSNDVYACSIFNSMFGGAMSSRLFQRIREEKGLVYSVVSSPVSYKDCGLLEIYAGTNPGAAETVISMIRDEAALLAREGMTSKEFIQAREQLKSSYILGLESTSGRMQAIGRRKLIFNNTRDADEVLRRINAVTIDEANELAKRLLSGDIAYSLVGNSASSIKI